MSGVVAGVAVVPSPATITGGAELAATVVTGPMLAPTQAGVTHAPPGVAAVVGGSRGALPFAWLTGEEAVGVGVAISVEFGDDCTLLIE